MLNSGRLPKVGFVDESGTQVDLKLSEQVVRISGIANHLRGQAPPGSAVGLMFRSGPDLVLNWLACVGAGMKPLVMQYPTRKQSATYWADSVRHTVDLASLSFVLADNHCAALGLDALVTTIAQRTLDAIPDGSSLPFEFDNFDILQLSSGTTGHRKAVAFSSHNLREHIVDLNHHLALTKSDKVISWLPLYHDMGYIACFVMPLVLGVDFVMIDPIDWVRKPQLLFDAIARNGGTVCYMPNFGYEVMARCEPTKLPTMRWWVSCSEPVSVDTSTRFIHHIAAQESTFAACYAMAENVFAVSIRKGLTTAHIDEARVVSCGRPIRNVDVKVVEGEFWVRSPTSLRSYIGQEDLRDSEGFYATGDLGRLIDGELYVTGRKQDLLIQAGRKYMLSDIDLIVNRHHPQAKGRAATIQVYDDRLGTQKPVILIESADFFLREDQPEIESAVKTEADLDQLEVVFVPPRFLTKTSSGKFNRNKIARDWQARQVASAAPTLDPQAELRRSFPSANWTLPVEDVLDSLSLTVLQIILGDTPVTFDGKFSLEQLVASLGESGSRPAPDGGAKVISIVSLAERNILSRFKDEHLTLLSEAFGMPVTFEHVCLPPASIVLSDLVFCDWFLPRVVKREAYAAVERAMHKLRNATIIVTDDVAEMFFAPRQVYGALSHNFERHPLADLVAVRWQRYAQQHHQLPLTVVSGADLPFQHRSRSLELLGQYLRRPVFRIATVRGYGAFTRNWEHRTLGGDSGAPGSIELIDPELFARALVNWALKLGKPLETVVGSEMNRLEFSDMNHYCSQIVNAKSVDRLLAHYQSFCVAGFDSSVPYVRRRLEALGKPYLQVTSHAPEILAKIQGKFDCLLVCGPQGRFAVDVPAAALMSAGPKWENTTNINDPAISRLKFAVGRVHMPASGDDWFCPLPLGRGHDEVTIVKVREMAVALAPPTAQHGGELGDVSGGMPALRLYDRVQPTIPPQRRMQTSQPSTEEMALRAKKIYIAVRTTALREELKAVADERQAVLLQLNSDAALEPNLERELKIRRVYLNQRPDFIRAEIRQLLDERTDIDQATVNAT